MSRSIVLRGADGSMWDLCDGPVQAGLNPQLWGSGAVQVSERAAATIPGSRVTNRRHQANDLIVPLVVLDPVVYPTTPWSDGAVIDDFDVVLTNGWPVDDILDEEGEGITDGPGQVLGDIVAADGEGGEVLVAGAGAEIQVGSLEATVAEFARALDSVRGDVKVTVGRQDGEEREIAATYIGGWSQLSMSDRYYGYTVEGSVVLRAMDPYWSSVADESVVVVPPPEVFTEGTTPFDDATLSFDEAIPFDGFIVDDVLFSDPTVQFNDPSVGLSGDGAGVRLFTFDNTGDVDAWPSFEAVGPASVVEVDDVSSGVRWRFDDLAAGEVLKVSTQPGQARVTVNGVNAFGRLVDGSQLWPLKVAGAGETTVAIRFDGGDASVSQFTMWWRPRYLTC